MSIHNAAAPPPYTKPLESLADSAMVVGMNAIEGWGGSTPPKTDPALLARLVEAARNYKMTADEVREQRVSFVYGQMNGEVTKEWVRQKLAAHLGWETPSPT